MLDEKLDGRIMSTYEVDPGSYTIEVTCTEDGTEGTMLVVAWDKDEYEQQDADFLEALEDAREEADAA